MDAVRKIYEHVPATIEVPVELQNKKVEIIMLPLEQEGCDGRWTPEFLSATMGAWEGTPPVRGTQGEYPVRGVLD